MHHNSYQDFNHKRGRVELELKDNSIDLIFFDKFSSFIGSITIDYEGQVSLLGKDFTTPWQDEYELNFKTIKEFFTRAANLTKREEVVQ